MGRASPKDSPELLAANRMLQSAGTGDVADFKRCLADLLALAPGIAPGIAPGTAPGAAPGAAARPGEAGERALRATDGNDWTALQLASAADSPGVVREILRTVSSQAASPDSIIDYTGPNGMSALMIALNNGCSPIALDLIDAGASVYGMAPRERNSAFLICRGGDMDILNRVIDKHGSALFKGLAESKDSNGYTSLHVAALMGHAPVCSALLDLGLDPAQHTRDGSTALHIACRNMKHPVGASSRDTVLVLLPHCPMSVLTDADTFGSSPLHVALSCSNIDAVKGILNQFPIEALMCQDNDGLHPTHVACQQLCSLLYQRNTETDEAVLPSLSAKILDAVCCVQELVAAGYPLDQVDYSEYTVFHNLGSHPHDEVLQLVGLFVDAISLSPKYQFLSVHHILEQEAANGLTCLHNVYQNEGPCKGQLLNLIRSLVSAEFLSKFNENKPRGGDRAHRDRCGAHNRIPLEVRRALLSEEYTAESVANHLLSLDHTPRVIALIGAGISTSAGIPDFRSNDGLYSNNATSNMFSVQFLTDSPELFYGRLRDMFLPVVDKTVKPTSTHALFKVLKDAGWLKRVYTQNIDMLEYPMLAEEDVVECHGSCKTARCLSPDCTHSIETPGDMETEFWGYIRRNQSPKCKLCSNYLRPDVVFFGEPLPERFNQLCFDDLSNCDLLLVMGTTLLVYPVASLPQMVGPECVRMLINRDASGCFQGVAPGNTVAIATTNTIAATATPATTAAAASSSTTTTVLVPQYTTKSYRDIFYQGNCDEGAIALASHLGMEAQLEAVRLTYC
jgi:NAD-dependent deacetylase sirtuin 2